jgi:hypothetical protein
LLYSVEFWPYNKPDRGDKRVTYCVHLHPPLALTDPLKAEDSKVCREVINHFISRASARQTKTGRARLPLPLYSKIARNSIPHAH